MPQRKEKEYAKSKVKDGRTRYFTGKS